MKVKSIPTLLDGKTPPPPNPFSQYGGEGPLYDTAQPRNLPTFMMSPIQSLPARLSPPNGPISKLNSPICQEKVTPAIKTPVMPSQQMVTSSTDLPLPRQSPAQLPRSISVPANGRVPTDSRALKSSSLAPRSSGHVRNSSGHSHKSFTSTPGIANDSIVYHDPDRRATIWKSSPKTHWTTDEDDNMIHQQILQESRPGTKRVRVSLGDINIEIESNGDSPGFTSTPRVGRLEPMSPEVRTRRESGMGSAGASSRKAMGGEIPSTPGSSPIKFKSESLPAVEDGEEMLIDDVLNDEDLMRIDEDIDLREPLLYGLKRSRDAEMQETIQIIDPVEDEEIPDPGQDIITSQEEIPAPSQSRVVRHELGTNHMGQETQALFSTEENEDLSIPNVEITPSPAKINGVYSNFDTPTSKWLHSLDHWVAQKADRYSVDPEAVWWILERTGCKRKLAVTALKYFAENGGISS